MIPVLVGVAAGVVLIPLAVLLIRFNRKRTALLRAAETATPEQLERIYASLVPAGAPVADCGVLAPANRSAGNPADWGIPVPDFLPAWAGRTIRADGSPEQPFRFEPTGVREPVLLGRIFRLIQIPGGVTRSGRARRQLSPEKYLRDNEPLRTALSDVCRDDPAGLLPTLLAPGARTFEFDPIQQARLGGSPSWVQDAEYPVCDVCRKRMELILQMPGGLMPGKVSRDGTWYLFGCPRDPESTKTVAQFS